MSKGFLTVDGRYRKSESAFGTVNGIYRRIKKGFRTVDGVYEQVLSSGVVWNKYACTQNSTTKRTYTKLSNSSTTRTIYFGPEAQIESIYRLYKNYSWGASSGYSLSNPKGFYIETAEDAMGYYEVSTSGKYEYLWEVTSATNGEEAVTLTRIGRTSYEEETVYSYTQGDLIGTVEAEEGELPENLTLVHQNDTRIILKSGSTYYYYTKADIEQ